MVINIADKEKEWCTKAAKLPEKKKTPNFIKKFSIFSDCQMFERKKKLFSGSDK